MADMDTTIKWVLYGTAAYLAAAFVDARYNTGTSVIPFNPFRSHANPNLLGNDVVVGERVQVRSDVLGTPPRPTAVRVLNVSDVRNANGARLLNVVVDDAGSPAQGRTALIAANEVVQRNLPASGAVVAGYYS